MIDRYTANRAARTLLTAVLLSCVGVGIVPANAADFSLRAVADSDSNDPNHDGLMVFKDFVESRSNGAIEIELSFGTQLCANGIECLRAVEDGPVDIYVSSSGGAAKEYPYVQVLDLPYILSDDKVAEQVLSGNLARELRSRILSDSDDRIRLMTIGNAGGWRHVANARKPVRTPDDMSGLAIRTVMAELPQALIGALGATPTPVPWPELFTALQSASVEGAMSSIVEIMIMRFPEAGLKYVTLDGNVYVAGLWFMNNEIFLDMPEALRRVVVDGFAALQQATFASPKRQSIQAFVDFADAGGELYAPTLEEKEAFRTAAAPVYRWFVDNIEGGDQWLKLLEDEAARAREADDAAAAMDIN